MVTTRANEYDLDITALATKLMNELEQNPDPNYILNRETPPTTRAGKKRRQAVKVLARKKRKLNLEDKDAASSGEYLPSDYEELKSKTRKIVRRKARRRGVLPVSYYNPPIAYVEISKRQDKFIISFRLSAAFVPQKVQRIRRLLPKTNDYGFVFGEDRLSEHISPTLEEFKEVEAILERECLQSRSGVFIEPVHAAKKFTIDSVVRVIMSQTTANEVALDAHQFMIRAFPYIVNGETYYGKVPNYHAMRVSSEQRLVEAMRKGGLYSKKPAAIKRFLDEVYAMNVRFLGPADVVYDGNETGATDFVPGLLSLDYFWSIYEEQGKQGLLDYMLSFPLIGVKTASCVMAFNMEIPVLAVDVHVAEMATLLGWVPYRGLGRRVDEDDMCSHLDARAPDGPFKLKIHQLFWQHRRNCARCAGRVKLTEREWAYAPCPLEHLIVRTPQREALQKERELIATDKRIPLEVARFTDSLMIRAAQRKAAVAAQKNEVLTLYQNNDVLLRMDGDRVRKGKEMSRLKRESSAERMARGEERVVYDLDDNFDGSGAYVLKREIWVPRYDAMAFLEVTAAASTENVENEDVEELIIYRGMAHRN